MKRRLPAILRDAAARLGPSRFSVEGPLTALADEIANNAVIRPIDPLAPGAETWLEATHERRGERWHDTAWYFAEALAYRLTAEATRHFETGLDPFADSKREELGQRALDERVALALSARTLAPEERIAALLTLSLWGNRIDLSYALSRDKGLEAASDDLLADDRERAARLLLSRPGPVHLVADNTGTELALDLALCHGLLSLHVPAVELHLKLHPTFVSDATRDDALALLDRLAASPLGEVRGAAHDLAEALAAGRLRLRPHAIWNGPQFFFELPRPLCDAFTRARAVIVKGDANYRRVLGDALWPADTSFEQAAAGFPGVLVALRTLKSDPLVGLAPGRATELLAIDPLFRVNGRRGVAQVRADDEGPHG